MPSEGRPSFWTIRQAFAPALVAGIVADYPDPLDRARLLILLPSRRAARALTDAFLAASAGAAALLPRMGAIGDPDEDEALGRFAEESKAAPELPPATAPLARDLALLKLLLPFVDHGPAGGLGLARTLGRLLDSLAIHGVTLGDLAALDLGEAADHVRRGRDILAALGSHWPALLAARGLMGPADRREALLTALAKRWADTPPPHPVIAAGFASAPPAVARLLGVIARLPDGRVVLPDFDCHMDAVLWDLLGTGAVGHPDHGMAAILRAAGATPADVRPWPATPAVIRPWPGQAVPLAEARLAALDHALVPAALADRWAALPPALLDGVALAEGATPEQEALLVALAMRRQLDVPGATAALVTPSRALARRVAAQLRRWALVVDDSAGEPLRLRPHGRFLLALADAAARRFPPTALIALLQQPLAGGDDPDRRAAMLGAARAMDLALRGIAPAPGLDGIAARLRGDAAGWFAGTLRPMLDPLDGLFQSDPDLAALLEALVKAAEVLAGEPLWAGPDGRALAGLVEAIGAAPDAAQIPVPAAAAVPLLGQLLESVTVRPPWRQHPRLAIHGLLEARLGSADLMILGGLDDGQWPADPAPDPWLAPAVRRALGLPPAEARIGLMAHDFRHAFTAPRLLLTRARRDSAGATVPSRFLLRLEAALGRLPCDADLESAARLDGGDQPARASRPAPAPPAASRPRALSVRDSDLLAADPYAWYAKRILKLAELDPLEQPADAAVRGLAVHDLMERLVKRADPLADATDLVDAVLGDLGGDPALAALWRPRLLRMVAWVREQIAGDIEAGWVARHPEVKLEGVRHGVRIHGRADRIDVHADGRLRILDYKTGTPPGAAVFQAGMARQLPLLRFLLEESAALGPGEVTELLYLKLSGGRLGGAVKGRGWVRDRAAVLADLDGLIGRWLLGDAAFVPKLHPVFATATRTWDHLARLEEWLGREAAP